jgi:PD-(D/E)XK nuclease superfamily
MTAMKPWTYSQLEKFETCPRQFYETTHTKKYPFVQSEASLWGNRVHAAFENVFKNGDPLPTGMTQWQGLANQFAAIPGTKLVEKKFAIDRNFASCDYWDSWSRGNIDLTIIHRDQGVLVDWKTGKYKPTEQLMLYAGYAFANYPQLTQIQTAFAWLKDKKLERKKWSREEVPVIWQEFVPRIRRMELAHEKDDWKPRPSGLCKGWCPVTDCEHWEPKK